MLDFTFNYVGVDNGMHTGYLIDNWEMKKDNPRIHTMIFGAITKRELWEKVKSYAKNTCFSNIDIKVISDSKTKFVHIK